MDVKLLPLNICDKYFQRDFRKQAKPIQPSYTYVECTYGTVGSEM